MQWRAREKDTPSARATNLLHANSRFRAITLPAKPATPTYRIPGVSGSSLGSTLLISPDMRNHSHFRTPSPPRASALLTLDNPLDADPALDDALHPLPRAT